MHPEQFLIMPAGHRGGGGGVCGGQLASCCTCFPWVLENGKYIAFENPGLQKSLIFCKNINEPGKIFDFE